ncbi:Serine/threonine-protein kinase STE11 [Erysiphe necator]|uniref:mitogen-activated protein kinase kinase kinase n=1 Tax=Uncinula necator TaxID=52586 RepID=A0A0B1P2R5_UNCNE|nr:Serine/threonine-protein kinase STE11 [Erysiphe necator]KHJ32578.1 putative ste ste11 protein kinase protein [Erysiphe necator]
MALLASQSPYPAPLALTNSLTTTSQGSLKSSRRTPAIHSASYSHVSPTDSGFFDVDDPESTKNWDEEKVCEWLKNVNCGEYESLFRKNNINGPNLLEMDKVVLQEMGITKIGDRVRLYLNIKKLRVRSYSNQKKRGRESLATLDTLTSFSSDSSRYPNPASHLSNNQSSNKRYSRQFESSTPISANPEKSGNSESRPLSNPPVEVRAIRQQRKYCFLSSGDATKRENTSTSKSSTSNSTTHNARRSSTPTELQVNSPVVRTILPHSRGNGSIDGSMMGQLPHGSDIIRVISSGGASKTFRVADCASCDEVMRMTLRKFGYREDHDRNYCFYVLDGLDPDPSKCRRLSESELWRIIKDSKRSERNRLILRKIHQGEPGDAELQRAAAIAAEEITALQNRPTKNLEEKITPVLPKIISEHWKSDSNHPASPSQFSNMTYEEKERERNVCSAAKDLERPPSINEPSSDYNRVRSSERQGVLRQFFGARPPSELITSDLTTYFPDHPREEIDRTARLSIRRSTRLSKVNSRLSVASNFSYASSIENAPPMPTIADTWLSGTSHVAKIKPLDLSRNNPNRYRDSVTSCLLEPLREESISEPSRKSFVSSDYGSDTTNLNTNDSDSRTSPSYYEDAVPEIAGSLRDISQALNNDDEEEDLELQSFLAGDSWDDSKWMKGALIGQGSFGSVYLALHAVTGELLAVKQVETPSPGANSASDSRKKSMIDALKREISLLRDLQHPNIVQYLGASSSSDYLNIFLEYVPGGSVQTMLNSYGALREPLVRNFVRQIVTGLAYLHGREIIHRDIKGANILVDNKGGIKISDFGISKKMEATNLLGGAGNSKNRPSLQGSVFWMAPEVVKQTSYTRKADIWSLGCLIVEMMTGKHPFPDCSQLQAIFKIGGAKASPAIPSHASSEAQTFLKQAFEIEHTKRPSAEELLFSPFLNRIT